MTSKTLGFILLGGGLVATAAGAIMLARRNQGSLLGRETVKSGGMTLVHHRKAKLPIKERVGILQDLTHKSIADPQMRKLALQITRHCKSRDDECEGRAIHNWIKKNIRYTGDIGPHKLGRNGPVEGIDLFQTAARTVEFGGGDCDDHGILGCTLGAHNGFTCKYRVTSPTRGRGDDYAHIYGMLGVPKNGPRRFKAIDTTLPNGRFGTEAPNGKHLDFDA